MVLLGYPRHIKWKEWKRRRKKCMKQLDRKKTMGLVHQSALELTVALTAAAAAAAAAAAVVQATVQSATFRCTASFVVCIIILIIIRSHHFSAAKIALLTIGPGGSRAVEKRSGGRIP